MKQRIEAVQRLFWAVAGLSLVVIAIGVPMGNDGETMSVLQELTAFSTAFDQNRSALEESLLAHGKSGGAITLDGVAQAASGDGLPKLKAAESAAPIAPLAAIELRTIEQIQALAAEDASLPIAKARAEELGVALAWRIGRATEPKEKALTLSSVTLLQQTVTEQDAERERAATTLRRELRAAEKELSSRQASFERVDNLYEQRKKWRATWKVLQRTNEERTERKTELDKAQASRDELSQRFDTIQREADAALDKAQAFTTFAGVAGAPQHVVASATLVRANGDSLVLKVATTVDVLAAPVPRITGAELPLSRASALWPELAAGTGAQAIERVRKEFSWHYAHVAVGPLKLGGMTVLQFAPLLLVPLLVLLTRRSRRVSAGYNPFDRDASTLPSVGLGVALNSVVLVLLPLLGAGLCTMSLLELQQLPVVPVAVSALGLWLGVTAVIALRDLVDLRDAVRQSHSAPPPSEKATR